MGQGFEQVFFFAVQKKYLMPLVSHIPAKWIWWWKYDKKTTQSSGFLHLYIRANIDVVEEKDGNNKGQQRVYIHIDDCHHGDSSGKSNVPNIVIPLLPKSRVFKETFENSDRRASKYSNASLVTTRGLCLAEKNMGLDMVLHVIALGRFVQNHWESIGIS